jgi:hypothetical protein
MDAFEAALVDLYDFLLDGRWRIDLFNRLAAFVRAASHYILFHFEFQAAVIAEESFVLPLLVFGEHERRVTILADKMALAILSELFKHFVFGEEVMVQGFSRCDSLGWLFLEKSLHEVEP